VLAPAGEALCRIETEPAGLMLLPCGIVSGRDGGGAGA
jgi:hypothetical protein